MNRDDVAETEEWSDYSGDEIYGDFEVDNFDNVDELRSFEPGVATVEPWNLQGPASTKYFLTDMLGTTRLMTTSTGGSTQPAVYTAFGELVSGTNHRYGYAGAWGYQSHEEFPFLHVGARYYDPSSGRFLQRDPIGIESGLNVYRYVFNSPTWLTDATGLIPDAAHNPNIPGDGPSSGRKPGSSSNTPWSDAFIDATGGRESWLDDPDTVDKVRKVARGVTWCIVNPWSRINRTAKIIIWGASGAGLLF